MNNSARLYYFFFINIKLFILFVEKIWYDFVLLLSIQKYPTFHCHLVDWTNHNKIYIEMFLLGIVPI